MRLGPSNICRAVCRRTHDRWAPGWEVGWARARKFECIEVFMKIRLYCACAALALAALPCLAAGSSWDGTWKMNVAKSKFTGDTFTITAKGNMMNLSNGTVAYDFACDGKAYPTIADRTVTCSGSPAAGYDFMTKAGNN